MDHVPSLLIIFFCFFAQMSNGVEISFFSATNPVPQPSKGLHLLHHHSGLSIIVSSLQRSKKGVARDGAAQDASHELHVFLLRRRKDYWVASREFSTNELRINLSSDGASPVSVVDVSSGDLQGEERCIWLGPERFHPFPINLCTLLGKVLKEKRFIGHAVYIYGTRFSFFPHPCALRTEIRVSKPLGPCLGGFFFFNVRYQLYCM